MRTLFMLLTLFLLMAQTRTFASDSLLSVQYLRAVYVESVNDGNKTTKVLEQITRLKEKTPLYQAYEGAFEALMAKHAWNPYKKLAFLKKSQKTLEQAIAKSPKDAEMRFLRFSIQHYLPEFLKDSEAYKSDFKAIMDHLGTADNAHLDTLTRNTIAQFVVDSGNCTPEQKAYLLRLKAS